MKIMTKAELALLLIAVAIVCIVGAFILISSSQDQILSITGAAVRSGDVSVNVTPLLSIVLTSSSVNFGVMEAGDSNNTSNDDPVPFAIENNGTVNVDITVSMNQSVFSGTGTGNNSTTFQYKAGNCSVAACGDAETDCFDWDNSITTWTPFTLEGVEVIDSLNNNTTTDEAEVEIYISVPVDEPGGGKAAQITFTASEES